MFVMRTFLQLCALGGAMAVSIAACSDSSGSTAGGGDEPGARIAQAGLTTSGWSKLDATLRTRTLSAPIASSAASSPAVSVFVQTKDPEGTRSLIEAAGGTVGTVAGDVMTARVPAEAIAGIANNAIVSRMEGGRPVRTKLDKAAVAVRADQVHAGAAPLPASFKGSDVIVGVVDNGMDLKHAAFKKVDGKTRVRALWAQGAKGGRIPAGFNYGSECDAAEIDAQRCGYTATTAYHGTHVMGIAAGGSVQGVPYVGMAPEAELVFVDLDTPPNAGSFEEAFTTAVCDGVSYIFKMADAANKPAVVNLSLGEHTGPHDGSSLADKCLDNLIKPGRLVVASAGNEGRGTINPLGSTQVAVHATATASATPIYLRWLPGRAPGQDGQLHAEQVVSIWSDPGSDLGVRVGFVPASGGKAAYSKTITVDGPLDNTLISDGTVALGPVGGSGTVSSSGARNILISMLDNDLDHKEEQMVWLLEISGNGKFDAFIDTTTAGGFLLTGNDPAVTVNHDMTIGYPAIASKVLAIGSFTTRNTWTAIDGVERQKTEIDGKVVTLGALSAFSSHGPSRNGVGPMKPDITAPGELLVSALNSQVPTNLVRTERVVKANPNGYAAFEGTSMSSPAAAGVIALMLQRNPQLTVDDVRAILGRTAVKPDGATVPSTTWGYGKLDALAALSDSTFVPPQGNSNNDVKSGCNVSPTGSLASGLSALAVALCMLLVRRKRRG